MCVKCQLNRLEHKIAQKCQMSIKQTRAQNNTDVLSNKETRAQHSTDVAIVN